MQAAVTGSRSGATAIAPTIRIWSSSITPNAAITPATAMKTRYRTAVRALTRACPSRSAQISVTGSSDAEAGPIASSRTSETSSAGIPDAAHHHERLVGRRRAEIGRHQGVPVHASPSVMRDVAGARQRAEQPRDVAHRGGLSEHAQLQHRWRTISRRGARLILRIG